ncbi:hypothetical protein REPUB_Repub11eG0100900 [Reevesia pubescens]
MLIAEVSSYWKNNAQMTAIAIDRMMGYRLISNLAIVRWVFSPENIEQFHIADHPWEILRNAVSKTYNRITDLRKEISSLKMGVISAEEAASKAKTDLEAAESKLALVKGEPVLGENPARLKRLKTQSEKANEEEVSICDSLEAKEALLARALDENEVLFLSLYKNFSKILMERLPDASIAGTLQALKSIHGDSMAVDLEESSAMEVDDENGRPKKSQSNGGRTANIYNVREKEQWCLSTLDYVKAFSRQYASEYLHGIRVYKSFVWNVLDLSCGVGCFPRQWKARHDNFINKYNYIWPHIEKLDMEVLTEDAHPLFQKAVYSGLRRLNNEV